MPKRTCVVCKTSDDGSFVMTSDDRLVCQVCTQKLQQCSECGVVLLSPVDGGQMNVCQYCLADDISRAGPPAWRQEDEDD